MQADKLQLQRFEIKYLVPESLAVAARDFVRSYLDADEFSPGPPNFSYPVHSLYLDSDDLIFYHHTFNGDKNRLKLRARFYDDNPDSPVFLEIKRRTNNSISKQRCGIRRDALWQVLMGQIPAQSSIVSNDLNAVFDLQNFTKILMLNRAKPKAHVAYWREAWVSRADNSLRITMDRKVRFAVQSSANLCTKMKNPTPVFNPEVILELKFTSRFPEWFEHFVRIFNLRQFAAAKYAEGITLFGEERMKNTLNHSFDYRREDGRLIGIPAKEFA